MPRRSAGKAGKMPYGSKKYIEHLRRNEAERIARGRPENTRGTPVLTKEGKIGRVKAVRKIDLFKIHREDIKKGRGTRGRSKR